MSLSRQTKARKHALDLLFAADIRGIDPVELLVDPRLDARDFTREIVAGVAENGPRIDDALRGALDGAWSLERMSSVDRAIARIAAWELLCTSTATAVAIAEAKEIAEEFSTPDSAGFVASILSRLAEGRA